MVIFSSSLCQPLPGQVYLRSICPSNLVIFHEEVGFLHAHIVEVHTAIWHLRTPRSTAFRKWAQDPLRWTIFGVMKCQSQGSLWFSMVFYGFLGSWESLLDRTRDFWNPPQIEAPRSPWLENAATRTARTSRVAKNSVVSQHVALLGKPFSRTHHVLGHQDPQYLRILRVEFLQKSLISSEAVT